MSQTLESLLDIAKLVLPPIGALLDDDDGEQMAQDLGDVVEAVVGHITPAEQRRAVEEDSELRDELKLRIEEAFNRQAEADNRALEAQRNGQLEAKRRELARSEASHKEELEEFQKALEDTEAARSHARKAAGSERWWVSGINPLLSIIIVVSFFVFIALIAHKPIGQEIFVNNNGNVVGAADVRRTAEGTWQSVTGDQISRRIIGNNLEVFYIAFGAMATAFVTVVGFHFGSSFGSKRKTELQRLYGTRGTLTAGGVPGDQRVASSIQDNEPSKPVETASGKLATLAGFNISGAGKTHPFEQFWMEELSHIEHFSWRELMEKGASNTGVGLNTDPPSELYPNVVELVNVLERIRKELGAPVQLLSVYRSPAYNRHVGGASSSRHMQFDAADFCVPGGSAGGSARWSEVTKRLRDAGAFKGGIGVYRTFVHVDTRGKNRDWDER